MINLRDFFRLPAARLVLPAERVGETLGDLVDIFFEQGVATNETVVTFEGNRELGKPYDRAKIGDLPTDSTFEGSATIKTGKIGPFERYQIVPVFKIRE